MPKRCRRSFTIFLPAAMLQILLLTTSRPPFMRSSTPRHKASISSDTFVKLLKLPNVIQPFLTNGASPPLFGISRSTGA